LAFVWEPGTLKNQSNSPKNQNMVKFEKNCIKKMALLVLKGGLNDVIREYTNMHKHPLIMYTSTENPKSKI